MEKYALQQQASEFIEVVLKRLEVESTPITRVTVMKVLGRTLKEMLETHANGN